MPSRKPLWPLLAVAMLSLTGCATPVSDACPPIVSYPPAVSKRLADGIERLPAGRVIPTVIEDYIRQPHTQRPWRSGVRARPVRGKTLGRRPGWAAARCLSWGGPVGL